MCTPFDRTGSLVALSTEAKKFSWGEEFQARVRVNFIVIFEPRCQQRDDSRGIRQDRQSSIVASEGFDEGLGDSIGFRRERTGVKQSCRPKAVAVSSVSLAIEAEPLSDNHSTTCGVLLVQNRRSTQTIIRSRTISPEIPAVVADQALTSRSKRLWRTRSGGAHHCGKRARNDRSTNGYSSAERSRRRRG